MATWVDVFEKARVCLCGFVLMIALRTEFYNGGTSDY